MDGEDITESKKTTHAEEKHLLVDIGMKLVEDESNAYKKIKYHKQEASSTTQELKDAVEELNPQDMKYIAGCLLDDGAVVWSNEGVHNLMVQKEGKLEKARFQIAKPNDQGFVLQTFSQDAEAAIELSKIVLNHVDQFSSGKVMSLQNLAGEYRNIYTGSINEFRQKYLPNSVAPKLDF